MSTKPRNALLMTRISDARNGDELGVIDQEIDERALAKRLGWKVGRVIVENDVSAYKRKRTQLPDGRIALRTDRPDFRLALDLLARGEHDGLIAFDLDRTCRDPRDLEDLIDVVEAKTPRIPVESVTGSLKLANDADVTMARVMVAVANKSSRDKSRRVARARERQSKAGAYNGGRRPFGYDSDGLAIRTDEAAEIMQAADALLAGKSLRQVTAALRASGVSTVTGVPWTPVAVRSMLLRPRNAGISVYKGEEVGKGGWKPILTEDTWRSVAALLNDPSRRTTPGNTPRWLGSGLYVCGLCGGTMRCTQGSMGRGKPVYRCVKSAHVARAAEPLDRAVTAVLLARLSKPEALATLRAGRRKQRQGSVDAETIGRELTKLETRLRELTAELRDVDGRPVPEIRRAMDDLGDKIAAEQAKLMTVPAGPDALDGIAGKLDAAEIWVSLDLDRQRAILDLLCTVTVKPSIRRGRAPGAVRREDGSFGTYFDPDSIKIKWKR